MMRLIQKFMWDWGTRAFGKAHMNDSEVRAMRFLEEAIELSQVSGVRQDKAHKLIDYVYGRPGGHPEQEIGGCFLTLLVLCECYSIDCDQAAYDEAARVLNKPVEHFTKRNLEKVAAGFGVDESKLTVVTHTASHTGEG